MDFPKTNLPWLWDSTLFLTRHGSHAYGTNIATSDEDFKGLCIPPKRFFNGFSERFEQAEFKHEPDMVVYDIRKFFRLAADCNPSIIEVLYTTEDNHRIVTRLGKQLLDNRDLFLSRKAKHTFSGYATAQLKKIRSHYKWLSNPPKAPPVRADFNLPYVPEIPKSQLDAVQAHIRKVVERWDTDLGMVDDAARIDLKAKIAEHLAEIQIYADDQWRAASRSLGLTDNFIDLMDRERQFGNAQAEWRSYQTWLETRNEKRSELERKFGYDTKHGMHLVRLMRMGQEILDCKGVIVKRPDAEELLAIRNGAWKYEELLEWADKAQAKLDETYKTSALRRTPDLDALDNLCQSLVESFHNPFASV